MLRQDAAQVALASAAIGQALGRPAAAQAVKDDASLLGR